MVPVRRFWPLAAVATVSFAACGQAPLTAPSAGAAASVSRPLAAASPSTVAGETFGPVTYTRTTGRPLVQTSTFAADPGGRYVLDITDDQSQGADGSVTLNGQVLLAPRTDEDTGARHLQVSITLAAQNTLSVRLTGKPGSTLTVSIRSQGWRLLSAGAPVSLAQFAYAPGLDAVFMASMPDYAQGSLWRFDLATAQWTQLQAQAWPNGKYRKLVYDGLNHRLLTYWDGLGQVYAIPETGGSWVPVGSAGNSQEYYEGYSFLDPVTDRLAVFAGYGYGTFKNTLWEWDTPANSWVAMPESVVRPDTRFGTEAVALDTARHRAFLGQRSLGVAAGAYDDLWALNLDTYAWTNLIPPYVGAGADVASALVYVPPSHTLYRFGGTRGLYDVTPDSQFYSADPDAATVAWTPVPSAGSVPGPRTRSGFFYDAPRHRLILVGGDGASDVWAYDVQ